MKKNRHFSLLAGLALSICMVVAETLPAQQVEFIVAPGVERARERFMEEKADRPYYRGWRVVVGITRDRRELDEMEKKFHEKFPEREVNWVFSDPFFRLLTGAYYSRWDVIPTLMEIRKEFPGAFEMNADIPYEEFLE